MRATAIIEARRAWAITCIAVGLVLLIPYPAQTQTAEPQTADPNIPHMEADPSGELLESGFQHLYDLDFQTARKDFLTYQKSHPEDPMGKAAEAASYLYEEFNEKGVLTSEFFLNDARFLGGIEGNPSENRNPQFLNMNRMAREMAKKGLKNDPRDVHDLLILTIADGMESNYDALIERKQLAALSMMRQAESEANTLLAIDPQAKDAYVALGMSNYVIGCLPSYKKMFLWFGGVHGDRARGIEQMTEAAEHGHYLRPFAKIMLALAYEREHRPEQARALLAELTSQFPANPHFAQELSIADQRIEKR